MHDAAVRSAFLQRDIQERERADGNGAPFRHRREDVEDGLAQLDRAVQYAFALTGCLARDGVEAVDGAHGERARLPAERYQVLVFGEPFRTVFRGTVADRVGEVERQIPAAQVESSIGLGL